MPLPAFELDVSKKRDLVAHEFRNLLMPLESAVKMLRKGGLGAEKQSELLELISIQLPQLSSLVGDLETSGELKMRMEPVDLASIVGQRGALCRPILDELELSLELSIPTTPVYVQGDPLRLHQLVLNLLMNACRYTPRGGSIHAELTTQQEDAVLSIQDTGIGVRPELWDRIFLPQVAGGFGSGLSLVKRIVQLHGGRISVASPGPGEGSTFTVVLPLYQPVQHRVLLLEDNPLVVASMSLLLRSWGHIVEIVRQPAETLEWARVFQPTIIFLDIQMPGVDGYDILLALKRDWRCRDIRVVALSDEMRCRNYELSRGVAFDEHLVTPPDPVELVRVLAEV